MKKIAMAICWIIFIACAQGQNRSLTVATYNMRYDSKDDSIQGNGWRQRYPVIADLIRFHDFDIFGTQECLHHQLNNLQTRLPDYSYIGVGRDDGKTKGEYAAIFYKNSRFACLNQGNFWLSENTETPNMGWDAVCIRICTWGQFQDMITGFTFYFFNLHLDHIGVQARKNSVKLVLEKINAMTNGKPTILTGDFNVDQHNESYQLLNTSGLLKDSYDLATICYAENGTFTGFDTNTHSHDRIDHIFVTDDFKVERYGILTDAYWHKDQLRFPSDHFPVVTRIEYR